MVSGNRWLISRYKQTWLNGTVVITFTTDIPVHIWMNYTTQDIRTHLIEKDRRGLRIMRNPYFCFTAYQTIEQDEAGDTLTHTITWPGWYNCLTQHFYFWAEQAGTKTPTNWGIFTKHYVAPLSEFLYPRGTGDETNIPFFIGASQHWQACQAEDTTWFAPDPHNLLGHFEGAYVYVRIYNSWQWFRDLYAIDYFTKASSEILSITIWLRLGKQYVYLRAKPSLKTFGVVFDGVQVTVPGYGLYWRSQIYLVNPITGISWTTADIAALQVGLQLAHAGTFGRAICDQVKVEISYRPVV